MGKDKKIAHTCTVKAEGQEEELPLFFGNLPQCEEAIIFKLDV